MSEVNQASSGTGQAARTTDVDVVVVGSGFSGLYMLHRLRQLGLTARAFEKGPDVGGTWWWNRYPGARSDSDSLVYSFSPDFDADLAKEWMWSERYPTQEEILKYLRLVADRLDLRRDITFNTKVTSAHYDEIGRAWQVGTDSGETITARFFILAVGALSKPNIPSFPGLDQFKGQWYHTARLPEDGVDYTGKRVGIIGNGATAVQIVPEVAKDAAHVYEFCRNPYHCIPGRNHKLDADDWADIHAHYDEVWERARNNIAGLPYGDSAGMSTDYTEEEIEKIFEAAWQQGGFLSIFTTFDDLILNQDINRAWLEFFGRKIRARVDDPALAERLIPFEPIGTKRPPIEHGYYSAFNRDNVSLVDIKAAPIAEITRKGVRLADGTEYEVDILLLATGFDAYTGTVLEMDIRGRGGLSLAEKWAERPANYLGLTVSGFPNMFMHYCGAYNPAILSNAITLIEQQGQWITNCLAQLRDQGIDTIEPRPEAEDEFLLLHDTIAAATPIPDTASWWTGTNVEGKPRGLLSWVGGLPEYTRICNEANMNPSAFVLERAEA